MSNLVGLSIIRRNMGNTTQEIHRIKELLSHSLKRDYQEVKVSYWMLQLPLQENAKIFLASIFECVQKPRKTFVLGVHLSAIQYEPGV